MAKIKTNLKHIRIPGVGRIPQGEWFTLPAGKEHIAAELRDQPNWEVELDEKPAPAPKTPALKKGEKA